MRYLILFSLLLLIGCAPRQDQDKLISLHFIDRNGFNELINSPDRLKQYKEINFEEPQPYQKISKVYKKANDPKNYCTVMSYHNNGQPWQSLQVVGGRAHGKYYEWYENGQLHMEGNVIEGVGDLTNEAKEGWMFDELNKVWDDKGHLIAEILYSKGILSGEAKYYHADGFLQKRAPFANNLLDGTVKEFDSQGNCIGETFYVKGTKEGASFYRGNGVNPPYEEFYEKGALQEATYYDLTGNVIEKIEKGFGKRTVFEKGLVQTKYEYREGFPQGEVELFNDEGFLYSKYAIKNGKKHGEEWVYRDPKKVRSSSVQPKLYLNWYDNEIHGIVKSWHENGELESQREYSHSKKNGVSLAWYLDGSLMLIEEYENDDLIKGSYMKRGEASPVSSVEKGSGLATLYDEEGHFLRKVSYQKGCPVE